MANNDTFMQLYNDLDEAIRDKYGLEKQSNSAINFYIAKLRKASGARAERFSESLDALRQLRNNLVHSSRIDGQELFEVSETSIKELSLILEYVKNPPRLIDYAVSYKDLLKADIRENPTLVLLNEEMLSRGISHVPVFDDGNLVGVYSEAVLFAFMCDHPELPVSELSLVDLSDYIGIEEHTNERYMFASRHFTLDEAALEFASSKKKTGYRLGLIFITEHGRPSERILAAASIGGLS